MAKFVPKEKLSKKAQKELNRRRRVTWDFSPVTKTVDSRKIYSRKRKVRNRDEYGPAFCLPAYQAVSHLSSLFLYANCGGSCGRTAVQSGFYHRE